MSDKTLPPQPAVAWWKRRTGLILPCVMVIVSIVLFVGTATMSVPSTATFPGPQVFPLIVAIATLLLAILLAVDVVRHPEPQYTRVQAAAEGIDDGHTETLPALGAAGLDEIAFDGDENTPLRPRSNVVAVCGVAGVVVVFVAALEPVGWLLSCALLFWGVAHFLGSRRPVADIFIAFAVSALVQLAFAAGLGLHLPPGILEGSLSWIR